VGLFLENVLWLAGGLAFGSAIVMIGGAKKTTAET
jgi:hypothetical protein